MPRKKKDAAEKAVDKIFEDLRDRRFLKWLFDNHEEDHLIARLEGGDRLTNLDFATQEEIRQAWIGIVRKAFKAGEMPKEAGEKDV